MSNVEKAWNESGDEDVVHKSVGWKELYLKEDWWAIWAWYCCRRLFVFLARLKH